MKRYTSAAERLRPWEIALLLALCITFCAGLWADRAERELSSALVRLHVVANSDSPADQAEKLQLRDRALALLSPQLAGCRTQADAVNIILKNRPALEALGDVSVRLEDEYFPTRQYAGFALPAGRYTSLRLVIGEGQGHNWWCVIFPPLCTETLAEETENVFLPLGEDNASLIRGQGPEYDLRFRVVELWGELQEKLAS